MYCTITMKIHYSFWGAAPPDPLIQRSTTYFKPPQSLPMYTHAICTHIQYVHINTIYTKTHYPFFYFLTSREEFMFIYKHA